MGVHVHVGGEDMPVHARVRTSASTEYATITGSPKRILVELVPALDRHEQSVRARRFGPQVHAAFHVEPFRCERFDDGDFVATLQFDGGHVRDQGRLDGGQVTRTRAAAMGGHLVRARWMQGIKRTWKESRTNFATRGTTRENLRT